MVEMDSEAAFGLPTPCYVAREFTSCHSGGKNGRRLLSLVRCLVELTLPQQCVDQPYQLASRQDTCSLVVMRGGLAILGLVICRILLVVHPQRVRGLDQVVAQIHIARVHHRGLVSLELPALVLLPDYRGEPGKLGVGIEAVDILNFSDDAGDKDRS